jgi:heptosyltransferase-3
MASAMRILLIKPKQIGDSLILTPTIRAIKLAHPEADIWVIVRKGCEGILAGCPDITRILTLAVVEKSDRQPGDVRRQIGVLLRLWAVKFDYVFELGDGHRGRLFAMLTRAKRRYSVKPDKPLKPVEAKRFNAISRFDWATCHRIEKDFYAVSEFLPLPKPVPPMIFEPEAMLPWAEGQTLQEYCVMQIGTRQGFNRWDREGWATVGRAMLKRFENVVISCGPAAKRRGPRWRGSCTGPNFTSGRTRRRCTWLPRAAARRSRFLGHRSRITGIRGRCRTGLRPRPATWPRRIRWSATGG